MDFSDNLFERRLIYPDPAAGRRFASLVGIDHAKKIAVRFICSCLDPTRLEHWARFHHRDARDLIDLVKDRPPLLMLAGDVGTGKTQFAESIGDPVARELGVSITLLSVSLAARGTGRVGEMTHLVSSAFDSAVRDAEKYVSGRGDRPRAGIILLIDEADALTQSREAAQMHHEDRAGVNALVRGVDRISDSRLPASVIMCTNRLSAIDPAVRRRASEILKFGRPDREQAESVLRVLSGVGLSDAEIARIAAEVTDEKEFDVGFTYSDLTQRLLPSIVLSAYPDGPINFEVVDRVVSSMSPTPPFSEERS